MKSTSRVPAVLLSLAAATLFLATEPGCTTTQKAQTTKKTAADDEWVTLPPALGSNVPRRVRRSQLGSEAAASGVDNVSGEAVMKNVRPQGPPPNAHGG